MDFPNPPNKKESCEEDNEEKENADEDEDEDEDEDVEKAEETVFYKRTLPDTCIALNSVKGKKLFQESLLSGNANIYFRLAEQFRTQAEPAYCGLATLVMVLNALEVAICC